MRSLSVDGVVERYAPAFLICAAVSGDAKSTGRLRAISNPFGADDESSQADIVVFPLRMATPVVELSVGRAPPNDIVLPHATISTQHAVIILAGKEQHTIVDLGSKNGTTVEDEAVPTRGDGQPSALGDKQHIRFGTLEVTYCRAETLLVFVRDLVA